MNFDSLRRKTTWTNVVVPNFKEDCVYMSNYVDLSLMVRYLTMCRTCRGQEGGREQLADFSVERMLCAGKMHLCGTLVLLKSVFEALLQGCYCLSIHSSAVAIIHHQSSSSLRIRIINRLSSHAHDIITRT